MSKNGDLRNYTPCKSPRLGSGCIMFMFFNRFKSGFRCGYRLVNCRSRRFWRLKLKSHFWMDQTYIYNLLLSSFPQNSPKNQSNDIQPQHDSSWKEKKPFIPTAHNPTPSLVNQNFNEIVAQWSEWSTCYLLPPLGVINHIQPTGSIGKMVDFLPTFV